MLFASDQAAVELYMDSADKEESKAIFDRLHSRKAENDQVFGDSLSWERLDEKRAARIRFVLQEGGLVDEAKWPTIQEAMVNAMDRLVQAIRPHLGR